MPHHHSESDVWTENRIIRVLTCQITRKIIKIMESKLLAAIVLLKCIICAIECNISGLYVDNGASQIIKLETMSFEDIQAMKYELSKALGLPAHRSNVVLPKQSIR